MSQNPKNNKISRVRTFITDLNIITLGALFCTKILKFDEITAHPFLSAFKAAGTMFTTILCAGFTQLFTGFHITNVMMAIANVGLILQMYNGQKMIS
uniref:Uncharacterized protein n=1 Tax=viral metagenome TaxID=1070528 RepID=A0A6C0C860_9ZZZZ